MFTYTVHKVNQKNGQEVLSHKEHLDNLDEVNEWLVKRAFNHVRVVQDQTQKARYGFYLGDGQYEFNRSVVLN